MIPTASMIIRDRGPIITTAAATELHQSEFADALQQYLAGTRRQDVGADSPVADPDPKASLTQRCKALAALINQRLAEGDHALDDDELQHLQALLAQFVLQQWPADGDPVLAKLTITPGSAHRLADGAAQTPGVQDRQPLLILPPAAKRTAKCAENPLPRLVYGNGQAEVALTRVRGNVPSHTTAHSDSLAATATLAPAGPSSTLLAAVTTDPAPLPAQTPPPAATAHLRQPLGSPAWQQHLGEHIMLFNRYSIFHAQLHLHPQELGAVKVNLRLSQEQLQVHFASDNQQVRSVLETAMTQLRTSLAENGIALGDTSVGTETSGHETAGQQQGQGESPKHGRTRSDLLLVAQHNDSVAVGSGTGYRGGIDIYA
ncbi:Flagellar hook-length control protein [Sodalis glossinidius str. 'morsitans']|uniref:Flagellar hook-length control protein n=1 Tax=Sodalis glossinidius (strain morsitans) TaxID=343509 RepID=Q2NX02_SODGM|nr:flagellar hook-length control protein FliK [Sodalis glossinidius]BAE73323.1 flagellar hook-length control protein FliK [Sodalis glossinidius str. 'morsitans']CRL43642.1 Flagellar hook-length control protein [Sodalis glossinidius str. 'morsitans']